MNNHTELEMSTKREQFKLSRAKSSLLWRFIGWRSSQRARIGWMANGSPATTFTLVIPAHAKRHLHPVQSAANLRGTDIVVLTINVIKSSGNNLAGARIFRNKLPIFYIEFSDKLSVDLWRPS